LYWYFSWCFACVPVTVYFHAMKVWVSCHETLRPRTENSNEVITILLSIGYKPHAFYFAFSAERICRYPFSCVILQCIQCVSAWESPSDAWEKVLQTKRKDYYGNYNIIEK